MRAKAGYFRLTRHLKNPGSVKDIEDLAILKEEGVRRLATQVSDRLFQWAKRFPTIFTNRIPSTALYCAATCPEEGVATIEALGRFCNILFAIDDIVDGTIQVSLSDAEAIALLDFYSGIVASRGNRWSSLVCVLPERLQSHANASWFKVGMALSKLAKSAGRRAEARPFYALFSRHFSSTMRAMQREIVLRRHFIGRDVLPTFEEYLDNAKHSIATCCLEALLLTRMNPHVDPERLSRAEAQIDQLLLAGACCVRLANDIRSYARETEIERKPNSILVVMKMQSVNEATAELQVIGEMDAHLGSLPARVKLLPKELQHWGNYVHRFTLIMRDWYMAREMHDFTRAMLARFVET